MTKSCETSWLTARSRMLPTPDPRTIATRRADNALPGLREPALAICLSGGGYRAMLFHVGALRRLNEFGLLSVIDRVSSVSGGSITAAAAARAWPSLNFGGDGVVANFALPPTLAEIAWGRRSPRRHLHRWQVREHSWGRFQ
jgi:Patatin-like phospholipase